jgi:hypothetical protein
MIAMAMTAPGSGAAAEIPPLVGETLAGNRLRLPSDIAQPVAVLIVGFTQKAGEQAEKWGMEVGKLRGCGRERTTEWYELPVLSSIPRLIRPIVIRAIRSGLAPELRLHFLPIYSEEATWKAAMDFSVRDDAYVAIVKHNGSLRFCLHGAFDTAKASHLRDQLQAACIEP